MRMKGCLRAQSGLHPLSHPPLQPPFYRNRRIIPRLQVSTNNRRIRGRPTPRQACARLSTEMGLGSCTRWGGSRDVEADKRPEGDCKGLKTANETDGEACFLLPTKIHKMSENHTYIGNRLARIENLIGLKGLFFRLILRVHPIILGVHPHPISRTPLVTLGVYSLILG